MNVKPTMTELKTEYHLQAVNCPDGMHNCDGHDMLHK